MTFEKSASPEATVDTDLGKGPSWEYQHELDGADGREDGYLTPQVMHHNQHVPSAYYDYETDKHLSHADAKLFYQRHKMSESREHGHTLVQPREEAFGSPPGLVLSRMDYPNTNDAHRLLEQNTTDSLGAETPDQHLQSEASQRIDAFSKAPPAGLAIPSVGVQFDGEAGPGSFANQDPVITSELTSICGRIQRILDLRHKYIRLSLQRPSDNPKDDSRWQIYPEPPRPVWYEEHTTQKNPVDNENQIKADTSLGTADEIEKGNVAKAPRKPGTNIGGDFCLADLLPVPGLCDMVYELDESGVYQVFENEESLKHSTPIITVPSLREYYIDLDSILALSADGPAKSFAFRRLQYLEGKFNLYFLLHEYQEITDSKKVPHRDFYNVRKVDTHVHHSSCMNQKHLLRFIKSKMKKSPDEIVMFRDGKELSLRQVFESINLTAYDLSIDTLDMHAHTDSFHRFDKFNLKYNPVGESRLRTIFLKSDNYIEGRYLAELTKEVISDLESSKYQMVEWRISVYGRSADEWDKLANWVVDNRLFSHNVRWLIQVPRLYDVYKSTGTVHNFEEIVRNIFQPLFEVTRNPGGNPKLHILLQRVVGFDSVDDESKPERRLYRKFPVPRVWDTVQNPPYSYWIYYLFANMTSLNAWRKQRGFNTFVLRPHCGEAGETDHLAAAVLCTHSINHGILLRKVPVLQYIFYLERIGIAMSPLSNNALFLAYERNPFLNYFKRGLNVSLSTDDPLQLAFTKEPLIEEYSVAAQIYKLNAVDMCELAKNSVLQSGFEHALKKLWLGDKYHLSGVEGNNVAKSNVPDIRQAFRHQTLMEELSMINRYAMAGFPADPITSETLLKGATGQADPPVTFSRPMSTTNVSMAYMSLQEPYSLKDSVGSTAIRSATDLGPSLSTNREVPSNVSNGSQRSKSPVQPTARSQQPQLMVNETWLGGIAEPRNFPGLVQEQSRRDNLLGLDNDSTKI